MHVVIVGGGFAGLNAAQTLSRKKNIHVTLIDRRNHHLFQPLLYQVAMAGLSPAEIAVPIRSVLTRNHSGVEVILDHVKSVSLSTREVICEATRHSYDSLILACGAYHSYFGHEEWEEFAPGLKTLEQATEIRRRVLLAFERAEREADAAKQKKMLTFVVVGGGPTGVELAGALGEISRYTLSRDFSHIDSKRTRILLIEAGSRILPSFSPELSARAARDLEKLGVTVWTSTRVTDVRADGVALGNEFIQADTVLWAAGVKPSALNANLGVELDSQGRIVVEKNLSLKGHPEVFVIGDQAHAKGPDGKPLPGLAPVAMQAGRWAAQEILRAQAGKPSKEFQYKDKGQMATIGRKRAIVEMKSFKLSGFLAWLTWLLVHIYYLIGFKNRLFVLIQWAWAYLSFSRGARLIVNKEWR